MVVREIETNDVEKLASLIKKVDSSSAYMLWEAGERNIQSDTQLKMIENLKKAENSTMLVAEKENELVGYLLAVGGNARRNKHLAYVVIGILKDFRGKGIGKQLFQKLEQWSVNQQIRRLELTVVTKNEEAISLYRKMGFEVEGTKRNSLRIEDKFVDEFYMSKLLR
ncbi:GNAT family N-acetyltransferase [Alkalicoccus daliensis]|uniref:L-amino acid N-acyltransferase YncA n=1 Tax=Alkalicoccus daliensis TaxID=745820 RepID=A0A1H0JX22_9BACI|nr:GNAT family N-acetyltransferase [Alkalicoccus daliensis]SDO48338.1 L-amino acid N-acyltransferase YncA [Alkalicoccus daliensis]